MKKCVIFGTTMFSAELQVVMNREGFEVIAYSVDRKYMTDAHFNGLPVCCFEELGSVLDLSEIDIILGLGYSNMNDLRKAKYNQCKELGFHVGTFCSKEATVLSSKIGEGCVIMPQSYIGPFSDLGVCNIVRAGAVLSHHDKIGNYNWIADNCTLGGKVDLGNNCFIGLGTTIRNRIIIEDYTFVGAHSYIGRNTNSNTPYIGSPAKPIIDKTSYEIIERV